MISLSYLKFSLRLFECVILLNAAIRRWVHYDQRGIDMVSNNTQSDI